MRAAEGALPPEADPMGQKFARAEDVDHTHPVRRLRSLFRVLFIMCSALPLAHGDIRHRHDHPLVVAYFGQWGLYNDPPYYLRDLDRAGAASLLDQINYAHASVKGGRCSVGDPRADLDTVYTSRNSVDGSSDDPASRFRGYFHQLKELKRRYPKLKILISLEGAPADFRQDASPEHRRAFVASCVDIFLRGRFGPGILEPGIFDGIDVNWEFPQQEDAVNFRRLLEEFRRQMKLLRRGLKLTIAVGDQPRMQPGTDFHRMARLVDEIGIMNYDYAGPWNSTTGLLAPLFRRADTPRHFGSIAESITAYENAGVPRRKLLMGIPFYGYQWSDVSPVNDGLFQRGKGISEDKPYRFIHGLHASDAVFRDPESQAPWLFDGSTFWTFEDPVSVAYKSGYAVRRHLGGVMIWELGEDTAEATLLTAAWRSLRQAPLPMWAQQDASDIPGNTGEVESGAGTEVRF